jgi:membrane protease YdiL (CAAX protease family)
MDETRGERPSGPTESAAVAGAAALGVTLTSAGVIAYAFDPARAGQWQMLGALGGFYAALTALSLYRLHRRGELRRLFLIVRGDITMAAVSAGVLYGGARIARSLLAGTPSELWLMRIYLQLGDLSAPGRNLLGAAVFTVAALEEIAWRGLVMRSMQDVTTGPRAAAFTTLLYAAAHLPTLSLLRMPGPGPNPLLVVAALGCGAVWSMMVLRSGRLVPAVLCHAVFTWSLIELPLWQPG